MDKWTFVFEEATESDCMNRSFEPQYEKDFAQKEYISFLVKWLLVLQNENLCYTHISEKMFLKHHWTKCNFVYILYF